MKRMLEKILLFVMRDRFSDIALWYLFFRNIPPPPHGSKTLIILNHMFEQDIESLRRANTSFHFVILPAATLRHIGTMIFPPSVESYDSYNSQEMERTRRRYRKIVDRFAKRLKTRYRPLAMISPSDNFFYVRELIPALQAQDIPFFVVDKEGTICPAYFVHFAAYIKQKCPMISDHILVWSKRQQRFWEHAGLDPSKISVVGQPRSDFWKQPQRWKKKIELGIRGLRADHKMILFFTYDPWAYTPDYMQEKGEMHWDDLRHETHRILYHVAKEHPEYDIVIKAHPQQLDRKEIQAEIDRSGASNVFLSTGSELSNHLIVNADCIIGFQTTALIESMVTNTPIIYTFWGEAREKWSKDLIPFHETPGVITVTSPDDLYRAALESVAHPEITDLQRRARDEFVAEYLYLVDGHSAERTLQRIDTLIRTR